MADKSSENTVRFTLITGQGYLITFSNDKEDHVGSNWEIKTSYKNTLSEKEVTEFGDLIKDCVAIVHKVL